MGQFPRGLTILAGAGCLIFGAGSVLGQSNSSSLVNGCGLTEKRADASPEDCTVFLSYNGSSLLAPVASPFASRQESGPPPLKIDTGYKVAKKFSIPGEGGWDYIAVDGDARRLYVSHGDVIQVLNADNGKLVGQIAAPGAHGVALAPDLHRGFTSNGKDKSVTVFDTKTLAVIKTVKLEGGTDDILYDPFTKRVFPMNEKITVIDAASGDVAGTVNLDADPEAAVSDGKGTVYVNEADKGAIGVIDAKAIQGASTAEPKPEPVPLSESILGRLPAEYRDKALSLVTATVDTQQRWLKLSDEDLAGAIIGQLGRKSEVAEFLLTQLDKESSAKLRGRIISSLAGYWAAHPQSQEVLEHHASTDPDAGVALQALEYLRSMRISELRKLLEARVQMAKTAGDTVGLSKLALEQDQHYSWFGNITLPGFLKVPSPVFSVTPADKPIRVLSFGDFGTGSPAQVNLAKAMVEYSKTHPFDFGLTLGDNFYPTGMVSPSDARWKTQWEELYGPLGIKFYPTFGNHDYGQPDSLAAEILYSDKSPDWRFPSPYYTFTAGPVQFFAVDNINLTESELLWLDQELSKSHATWKVVYGHYHIYSSTRGDNKELIERLLPVLMKNHVDIYLNGHNHNLEEVKPEGGVHFFGSGAGGAGLYDMNSYDRSVFREKLNGFTVLEADAKHFKVSFIGTDGKELHSRTVEK